LLCNEDAGSMDLRTVGISPQNFTASQPRRPRLVTWHFSNTKQEIRSQHSETVLQISMNFETGLKIE